MKKRKMAIAAVAAVLIVSLSANAMLLATHDGAKKSFQHSLNVSLSNMQVLTVGVAFLETERTDQLEDERMGSLERECNLADREIRNLNAIKVFPRSIPQFRSYYFEIEKLYAEGDFNAIRSKAEELEEYLGSLCPPDGERNPYSYEPDYTLSTDRIFSLTEAFLKDYPLTITAAH
ncbi:hypothetical protein [Gordonibacter massiliensis (ex Traore et al. 2017)]|uniref:Uncharacterized protein n=1 Tax=Gordonibacter massiliensis (ex Traore et al. 2017) TaxID=1841863 RepID=A0A842JID1_9ACTN|nr:hypothetical protein [Gordonibacter massiliensis (ex Traore et al. 2017)]MBC2888840.1 hypothetical protein [Gordonibacter massiliensis (ex Traore et al. 2017)]